MLLGRSHRFLSSSAASCVGATAVGPSIGVLREHPELVDRAAAQGRALYCWTCDDYDDVGFCRDIGVAWLATNYPGRVKAWLEDGLTGADPLCEPAAGSDRGVGWSALRIDLTRDEVLQVEHVCPGAVCDPDERGHQRHLLDLLLEEPLHELLAEVVALVAGHRGQPA